MVTHRNSLAAGYKLHWYVVESILGQGGFGITYLARDNNLDQLVAIKEFLPLELAVRENDSSLHPVSDGHSDTYGWGLTRFLSEAQTLAKFRHPNIVRVLSVFEENNTAYMVMEYEQGQSLEDALKFKRVEGETGLLALLFPLLDGLALVHEAGFIHRDIKPDNIFLREDGVPVLLDFGSARQALGVATRTLTSLVSPGFAPFEQYNATRESDKQGPWSDIYSLAATLYRAVSGHGPPDAIVRANAAIERKTDPLKPAAEIGRGSYSPQFLTALDRALEFLPERRPQSVAQWRQLFPSADTASPVSGRIVGSAPPSLSTKAAQASTAVKQAPPTGPHHGSARGEPRKRGPWLAIGVALVVFAALGSGAFFVLFPPERADDVPDSLLDSLTASAPVAEKAAQPEKESPESVPQQSEPEAVPRPTVPDPAPAVSAEVEQSQSAQAAAMAELEKQLLALEQQRSAAEPETSEQPGSSEPASPAGEEAQHLNQQQEEAQRLALEAQMSDTARREAEEAERRAEEQRQRAQDMAAQLAVIESERARRAEVTELLALADGDLQASRLTSPAGNNALHRYQSVLNLEPDNPAALRGLERIVVRYVELADRAAAKQRFDRARQYLARAGSVLPDSPLVYDTHQKIEGQERKAREAEERLVRERFEQERRAQEQAEALVQLEAQRAAEQAEQAEELERMRQEVERLKREQALKQQLEEQLARSSAAQASAPQVEQPKYAMPSRLAIFPFKSNRVCFFPRERELRNVLTNLISNESALTLTYSYHWKDVGASPTGELKKLWKGSSVRKEPNVDWVYGVGERGNFDGILMAWMKCTHKGSQSDDRYRFDLWIVDAELRRVHHSHDQLVNFQRGAKRAFIQFLDARK